MDTDDADLHSDSEPKHKDVGVQTDVTTEAESEDDTPWLFFCLTFWVCKAQ